MTNAADELDDLLADTPSSTEFTIDADEDSATDAAKAAANEFADLEELLGAAKDAQKRNKQHKADLKALRNSKNSPLEAQERKEAMMRVLEWESTHVWASRAQIQRFNVFTCKRCLRQSIVFDGIWLEQHHDRMKAKRLVRLPSLEEIAAAGDMMHFTLDSLAVKRVDVSLEVECCSECSPAKSDYTPAIKF